ncbi:type II toxin-antitoxin system VapC family toxin [Acidianus ambivalens]|uniref:PIN domain-containing protein n=1 Tax=Acidianus ambivalens TaxID=2283 RepID=A0A650CWF2_ACIAM|nr:type II toxin-antitoxin system VapC family toxin [Acidianus ambivalens]MQL54275.1 PIN domain-containing protein [Acidianus ambivalens]QGR22103.1 PIN domain-containing protein [Acidianus ambivalens]
MSYVFDSSSIYSLLTKGKIELLGGNYTVFLAKFELGNIVWKEVFLHKRISREEGLRLLSFISKVLNTMNLEDVNCKETEEIALDYGITFYDASYVWLARKLDLPLITEDNKLRKAVEKDLKVLSVDEIIK